MAKKPKSGKGEKFKQLEDSWRDLQLKHASWPKFAGKYGGAKSMVKPMPTLEISGTHTGRISSYEPQMMELSPRRAGKTTDAGMTLLNVDLAELERRFEGMKNNGTLTKTQVYTGEKVLGIAAMHKSNLVPVFSQEQAEDTAKMRRG